MSAAVAAKDDRLLLLPLEQIASLSDYRPKSEFRIEGYSEDQVARHMLMLRDSGLIHYIPTGDLQDEDDMLVKSPTAAGWDWMTGARARLRRPGRDWLARNWMWLVTTLIAMAAVALAVL